MKYCGTCGREISDDSKFCIACGAQYIDRQIDVTQKTSGKYESEQLSNMRIGNDILKEVSLDAGSNSGKRKDKKKKHKRKKKIIRILLFILSMIVVLTIGIFVLRWYTSVEQRALRAIDKGEYEEVLAIIEDDKEVQEYEKLAVKLEERVVNIQSDFRDGKIEYTLARKELDTIREMDIKEISVTLQEVSDYVENLNLSRINFATAESFYNTEDYVEAIHYYQTVIEDDTVNYETAKIRMEDSYNKYREVMLKKASEYADKELYGEALSVLAEALSVIPDDTKIVEQVRLYERDYILKQKEDVLKEAAVYAEQENYLAAINQISGVMKDQISDADLVSAYNKYCEQYVEQIITEVDEKVSNQDFDGALIVLKEAKKVLPDNEILRNKESEIEGQKPISITSLVPINTTMWQEWNSGAPMDPFGNDYSSACNYIIIKNIPYSYGDDEQYLEYRLYGNYATLSGVIAPYTDIEDGTKGYVQVLCDDKLVYTSQNIERKTDALDFSVNVSGVEYVKILAYADTGASLILSNVQLWP